MSTSARGGVHAQVDAILSELPVSAELDADGDWKLETDAGAFLLMIEKESSDLVLVQTIQAMEEVEGAAGEMSVLLALNFGARGIARFGAVTAGDRALLVLTARLAPDAISREGVEAMLRDSLRLSRRVDELARNAPG